MNIDLLQCKRNAQNLVASNDAPRNRHGRKIGYIEVMAELWKAKGYAHLGIKSQNLRDQASRLEKINAKNSESNVQGNDLDIDIEESTIAVDNYILSETTGENSTQNNQQSQNANKTTLLDTDLHTAQLQFPEETPTIDINYSVSENMSIEVPGCLPKYKALEIPTSFKWGSLKTAKQ